MRPCGFASAGSLYYKMWAGLNGFDPRNDLVLSGVRIGMGCMNLVTAISRSTLSVKLHTAIAIHAFTKLFKNTLVYKICPNKNNHCTKHALITVTIV